MQFGVVPNQSGWCELVCVSKVVGIGGFFFVRGRHDTLGGGRPSPATDENAVRRGFVRVMLGYAAREACAAVCRHTCALRA